MSYVDISRLKEKIKQAAQQAFGQVRERHSDRQLCGYALYSDTGAMTVCPSVNSVDHLKQRIEEYPDDALYLKWTPAEWAYEYEGSGLFQAISDELKSIVFGFNSEDGFPEFRSKLYELCVQALEELRDEGFFSSADIVVFSIPGFEGDIRDEIDWIHRLNSATEAAEFEDWLLSSEG